MAGHGDTNISVKLNPAAYDAIKRLSMERQRFSSDIIAELVEAYLIREGALPDPTAELAVGDALRLRFPGPAGFVTLPAEVVAVNHAMLGADGSPLLPGPYTTFDLELPDGRRLTHQVLNSLLPALLE